MSVSLIKLDKVFSSREETIVVAVAYAVVPHHLPLPWEFSCLISSYFPPDHSSRLFAVLPTFQGCFACVPSDHLTCLLRNLDEGQEATVRAGHGTTTGSKKEKEYVKAVYCHPVYLTSMQSTS